jgi:hypothetical protein
MKNRIVSAVCVMVVFLVTGCAVKHNLVIKPAIEPRESRQKSPVSVGVYKSPEFTGYTLTRAFSTGRHIAPIGSASEEMIDRLFPDLFEEVVRMDGPPPYNDPKTDMIAVIEPSIEYFNFYVPFDSYEEERGVTYRFTVHALNGVPVSSWLVKGQSPPDIEIPGIKRLHLYLEDAAPKILREMEQRFTDKDFIDLLEHARDLKGQSQDGPIDPASLAVEAIRITDKETIVQLLGNNLPPEKIAIVKLSLTNAGGEPLTVRPSDMRLEIPEGDHLVPACAPTVCSIFEKTTGVTAGLFGPLAGLAAAGGGSKKRTERMDGLKKNQIQEKTLSENGSMDGFLYFLIPEETEITDKARLAIWAVETGSANGIKLHTPIMRDTAAGN